MALNCLNILKVLILSIFVFTDVCRSLDTSSSIDSITIHGGSSVTGSMGGNTITSTLSNKSTINSKVPDISAAPPVQEQNKMMMRQAANSAIIKEGKKADENARVVRESSNAKMIQQARVATKAQENIMIQNSALQQIRDQNVMVQNAAAENLKQQNIRVIKEAGNARVIEIAKTADKAIENAKIQKAASNAELMDVSRAAEKASENIKVQKAASNQKIINEATTQAVLDNKLGATDRLSNKELIVISRSSSKEQQPAFVEMVESSEQLAPRSIKKEIDAHRPLGNTAYGPLHLSKSQQNPAFIEMVPDTSEPSTHPKTVLALPLQQNTSPAQGPANKAPAPAKEIEFVDVVSKEQAQPELKQVDVLMKKQTNLRSFSASDMKQPSFVDIVPITSENSSIAKKSGGFMSSSIFVNSGENQMSEPSNLKRQQQQQEDRPTFVDMVENGEVERQKSASKGVGFRRILKSGLTSGDKAALALVNGKRASKPGDAIVETIGDGKKSANDIAIETASSKEVEESSGSSVDVELGGDTLDEEIEDATTKKKVGVETSSSSSSSSYSSPSISKTASTSGNDNIATNVAAPVITTTTTTVGAAPTPTAPPLQNTTAPTVAPTAVPIASIGIKGEKKYKDNTGYEVLPVESKVDVEEAKREGNVDIEVAEEEEGDKDASTTPEFDSNKKHKQGVTDKKTKKSSDDDADDEGDDDADDEGDDDADDEGDDEGDDESNEGDDDSRDDDNQEGETRRQGGRGGGRGRGGKKGRGGRGGRGGNKGGRKGGVGEGGGLGKKKKQAQSDDGAPVSAPVPPLETGGISQVAPDHPVVAPPVLTRPKPKSAADAWAMYKAAHPDKPKEEENAGSTSNNMMSSIKGAIDINEDSNSNSVSSSSTSSGDSIDSMLDEDDEITEMSSKDGMMAKVVRHIIDTHQKAKDSWEGLETGLDFGLVLAFVLFVVFFVFWYMATKCCCRPIPGVAYTQISKVDANDDIDNDLEVGNIRPDKSPRVLQLQKTSPPLSRESSLEIKDISRVAKEPRYTDDGSGEVSYTDEVNYEDDDDEEASDESYVDDKEAMGKEIKQQKSHPVQSLPTVISVDHRGDEDRHMKSLHLPPKKNIDDDDDKYAKKSGIHDGAKNVSGQRYIRPTQPISSSSSSGGATALTAEETEKIAASLGITEYSGHFSTDGTPMRRIDEETRRSSPVQPIKSTESAEDSWGDDDLDLSDDED